MKIEEIDIEALIDYNDKPKTAIYCYAYYKNLPPYSQLPIELYELVIESYVDKLFLEHCLEKQIKNREYNNII